MKLRMHHIELCVSDPNPVAKLFCNQLGLHLAGYRETAQCLQLIFKMEKAAFVVTTRKGSSSPECCKNSCNGDSNNDSINNNNYPDIVFESGAVSKSTSGQLIRDPNETWTLFCCGEHGAQDHAAPSAKIAREHIDSVFNVVIQVENIHESVNRIRCISDDLVLQDVKRVYDSNVELGYVDYAVIKSCCGNVVHTLVEKSGYQGWFLPGFHEVDQEIGKNYPQRNDNSGIIDMTHFDHFTLACHVGESNEIIDWYERAFGMKRFLTNR